MDHEELRKEGGAGRDEVKGSRKGRKGTGQSKRGRSEGRENKSGWRESGLTLTIIEEEEGRE